MHAAGKGDTLIYHAHAYWVCISNYGGFFYRELAVLIKILGIVLFIFITTPTSSHALMRAAFEDDEMPLGEKDLKKLRRRTRRPSGK
jgi:multisubunit Na+/H+ antiporter MnhG subunit